MFGTSPPGGSDAESHALLLFESSDLECSPLSEGIYHHLSPQSASVYPQALSRIPTER